MSDFVKARLFIIDQRITELLNSIRHWPTSANLKRREEELDKLRGERKELDNG